MVYYMTSLFLLTNDHTEKQNMTKTVCAHNLLIKALQVFTQYYTSCVFFISLYYYFINPNFTQPHHVNTLLY